MAITLECKRCGHVYEVTPADIRDGTWQWRGCPVCHPRTEDQP
jgi:predicted  nucleic acid-binding Zn-ribbon protein